MNHQKGQRAVQVTFVLTLAFCVFEFLGAKLSHSLSLLADAGHMLTDLSALALTLFAGWMTQRRSTQRMSYGFYRFEILAALINGTALVTIAIFIVKEALLRFQTGGPLIQSHLMLVVAFIGLLVNLLCAFLLQPFSKENLNLQGAFFHIIADTLSSIGTLIAGLALAIWNWRYADPLAACAVALLIIISAWRLLKDVVEILLEAAPAHINVDDLEKRILSIPGICAIHDLHVWSISRGKEALSAHLEVIKDSDAPGILILVNQLLEREFQISHTTLQIENPGTPARDCKNFHD